MALLRGNGHNPVLCCLSIVTKLKYCPNLSVSCLDVNVAFQKSASRFLCGQALIRFNQTELYRLKTS